MARSELTGDDVALILESLRYTKMSFEDSDDYPSDEFKQQRVAAVDDVAVKVRALWDQLQENAE